MATRMQFSREFKVEAVKLVTERRVCVSQAARDLDVGETRRHSTLGYVSPIQFDEALNA